MPNAQFQLPQPINEPVKSYPPGSPERGALAATLQKLAGERIEIPAFIGGQAVKTGQLDQTVMPHDHQHILADYHLCGSEQVEQAITAASQAWPEWSAMPWQERAAIFLKAADLLAGPWRDRLNASTMLGQSKTVIQAEIDSACELIDFWRFNCHFMTEIYRQQPSSSPGVWNSLDYRPLEGFVFAVTPFNFTAIGGNLPTAPALMGNTVVWKPASTQVYSAWFIMQLLQEAGLPAGVINFVPGHGAAVGDPVLKSPHLAGIHFTGSTGTFQYLWRGVGERIDQYKSYPRLVGETGGKDFILAHPSADPEPLVTALVRGAFEYQGQKCSAASRAYIPDSLWDQVTDSLRQQVAGITQGDPRDFTNFMAAVIDQPAFDGIRAFIEFAEQDPHHQVIIGGGCNDANGYFIEPTVVISDKPDSKLMCEEIFGPVLTIYRYADAALEETLDAVDQASPYALTGAIFAQDRQAINHCSQRLRFAAGNFYINDKPTGAVVGQQPFGGGRASGTNDKAGSVLNLLRWVSPRTVKETFVPPTDYRYPHMQDE